MLTQAASFPPTIPLKMENHKVQPVKERERVGDVCSEKSSSVRGTWPAPWRPSHWGRWWRLQSGCLICTSPMPWKMPWSSQSSAAGTSTRWRQAPSVWAEDQSCFHFLLLLFFVSGLLAFKLIAGGLLGDFVYQDKYDIISQANNFQMKFYLYVCFLAGNPLSVWMIPPPGGRFPLWFLLPFYMNISALCVCVWSPVCVREVCVGFNGLQHFSWMLLFIFIFLFFLLLIFVKLLGLHLL